MTTIAVLNQKGGVGKTTLAVNLAACAHLAGLRAHVLDLDRQGSALDWYSRRAPGSPLAGLTVAKADRALRMDQFRELTARYDVVVCDGPARLGDVTENAAAAADVVLVPLKAGAIDIWALKETLALLQKADATRRFIGRPPARRVFVLTMVPPRARAIAYAVDALAKEDGDIAPVTIGNRVAFSLRASVGESVVAGSTDETSAREVRELYAVLIGQDEVARGAA